MKKKLTKLATGFNAVLKSYLAGRHELALQKAYEIGRQAVKEDFGILDLISAYQTSFLSQWSEKLSSTDCKRLMAASASILSESLSSFELVQKSLKEAITSLKHGSEALGAANMQMNSEIIERKHVEAQLRATNEALSNEILERKKVEKDVLEISLREQRRFGAELHDGLCQRLVGISMLIRGLLRNVKKGGTLEISEIEKVGGWLEQTAEQARNMAHGFFPVELKADALMNSLHELAKRVEKNYQIVCQFHCNEIILIEDNNVATHLFRITQEAINNARKHGAATNIDIYLSKEKNLLRLRVQDNGHGFQDPPPKGSRGIGLQIMKYRARMIHADLNWQAIPQHGILFSCCLSLMAARRSTLGSKTEPKLPASL